MTVHVDLLGKEGNSSHSFNRCFNMHFICSLKRVYYLSTHVHCLSQRQPLAKRAQTSLSWRWPVSIARRAAITESISSTLSIIGKPPSSSMRASALCSPASCRWTCLLESSPRAPAVCSLPRLASVFRSIRIC